MKGITQRRREKEREDFTQRRGERKEKEREDFTQRRKGAELLFEILSF